MKKTVTLGIYHHRYLPNKPFITDSDMVALEPENYALHSTVEIEIDAPEKYDWASHDERLKYVKIKELKAQLAKLEGGE